MKKIVYLVIGRHVLKHIDKNIYIITSIKIRLTKENTNTISHMEL